MSGGTYNGPDGQKLHGDGRPVRELQGERSLAKAPGSASCVWLENPGGFHDTQCGHAFEFTNDGIKENGFVYCPFCGKAIAPNTKLSGGGPLSNKTTEAESRRPLE